MKIVSLLPSATELVCGLGLQDQLVGVSHECNYPPSVLGLPILRNQSPPLRMICGTEANVSVLLIVLGLPYRPKLAGNGGLNRGCPFLPSSDSIRAVSSPQI